MSWLENLDVIFEHGEITAADADAIACPVTINLEIYGKLSQKLFTLGGNQLISDLDKFKKHLPDQKLFLGQAISLPSKPIYHIESFKTLIFMAIWDHQSEYSFNLFYKGYINALREAFHHGLKSIVLPIMPYDGFLKECGQAILKVIKDLDNLPASSDFSLEEIHFRSNVDEHIKYLVKAVEPMIYR